MIINSVSVQWEIATYTGERKRPRKRHSLYNKYKNQSYTNLFLETKRTQKQSHRVGTNNANDSASVDHPRNVEGKKIRKRKVRN